MRYYTYCYRNKFFASLAAISIADKEFPIEEVCQWALFKAKVNYSTLKRKYSSYSLL